MSHKGRSSGALLRSWFSFILSLFLYCCCVRLPACYVHAGCHVYKSWVTARKRDTQRWQRYRRKRDPARRGGVPLQSSGSQHLTLGSRRKCACRSVSVYVCSVISHFSLPTPSDLQPLPPIPNLFSLALLTSVALPCWAGTTSDAIEKPSTPIGLCFFLFPLCCRLAFHCYH